MFAALGARIGASVLFNHLKNVPWQVWLGVVVVISAGLATCAHQRHAKAELKAAYELGRNDASKEWSAAFEDMRAASKIWKGLYEAKSDELTRTLGEAHETRLRDIAAQSDSLRLRGPGAAAANCGPRTATALSRLPGTQGQPSSEPDAPGPAMPAEERNAVVPWGWLVSRAEEHDALLSEVETLRAWHTKQEELYQKALEELKAKLPKPKFGQEP